MGRCGNRGWARRAESESGEQERRVESENMWAWRAKVGGRGERMAGGELEWVGILGARVGRYGERGV